MDELPIRSGDDVVRVRVGERAYPVKRSTTLMSVL